MPRGKRKTARRNRGGARSLEPESTPQTRAKLTSDPLFLLLAGQDVSLEQAADEIRDVYQAIVRPLMSRGNDLTRMHQGKAEMTAALAWAHAKTYLPWVAATGRNLVDATLNVIVDRNKPPFAAAAIRRALADYARRMRERPEMPEERVA